MRQSENNNKIAIKETEQSKYNRLKWLSVLFLLLAGIVANEYYSSLAWAVRAAIGIVLILILTGIVLQTSQGQVAWSFIKGSRGEIRKVVWPTRQETVQTTLVVVAMVVIAALILWGLDYLFFELVGWLTGQRG